MFQDSKTRTYAVRREYTMKQVRMCYQDSSDLFDNYCDKSLQKNSEVDYGIDGIL